MANPAPGYQKKPEHRVDLLPETRRVRVTFAGQIIADSNHAVRCEETGHEPVHYVPEKDVHLELMRPTEHKTRSRAIARIGRSKSTAARDARKTPSGATVRPMTRRWASPVITPSTKAASMRSR